ncbi:hypothetical protein [Archangium violaceum]|uniref:hypothetical protein n=1 Tax=Archangium violaceum TaxID=83451 RepID=UPI0036D81714
MRHGRSEQGAFDARAHVFERGALHSGGPGLEEPLEQSAGEDALGRQLAHCLVAQGRPVERVEQGGLAEQGRARPVQPGEEWQPLGGRWNLDGQARDRQPCQLPLRLRRKAPPLGGGDERGECVDIVLSLLETLAQVQHCGVHVERMRGGKPRAKCIQRGACLEQVAWEVHDANHTARLGGRGMGLPRAPTHGRKSEARFREEAGAADA